MEEVLTDHLDLIEEDVGPTRSGRSIDRIFTNFHDVVEDAGTVPLLETEDQQAKKSDHMVAYLKARLPRVEPVKWLEYSYRYYNEDSAKIFGGWLAHKDWADLESEETSNGKAAVYQREVVGAWKLVFRLYRLGGSLRILLGSTQGSGRNSSRGGGYIGGRDKLQSGNA